MIKRIVHLIIDSNYNIDGETLFVSNYAVADRECLIYLKDKNCIENYIDIDAIADNSNIDLDLNLATLNSLGFFESKESFICRNKYTLLKNEYYILEVNCFKETHNRFISTYKLILDLINTLKNCSKYQFEDSDYIYSIIAKGDLYIAIPFNYNTTDLELTDKQISALSDFLSVLKIRNEKQLLFINELIELTLKIDEKKRFQIVLKEIVNLYENSMAAYAFYLSDFSSQKLKAEINTKLLEFSQKAQSIINDAQTKLIAIPVASIFAISSLETSTLFSIKNIAVIISLLIFAILISLFISSQRNGLKFITDNVTSYKNDMEKINSKDMLSAFNPLNDELKNQKNRLCFISIINWIIPIGIITVWLWLIFNANNPFITRLLSLINNK